MAQKVRDAIQELGDIWQSRRIFIKNTGCKLPMHLYFLNFFLKYFIAYSGNYDAF